jgi:excisionase family DNA binding protein
MAETVPQLLTLSELAKTLCVSPHTVRAWVKKGRLQPIRLCRRLLFHPGEIARFVEEAR